MIDSVPFDVPSDQVPFVIMEARAGDVPARVLLDTGAAAPFQLIVTPEMARRAGARFESGPDVPSSGALGQAAVTFAPARLPSFSLGRIRLENVSVGVSAAPATVSTQIGARIDAVAGYRFVEGRRLAIDYRLRTVDFDPPAGAAADAISFSLAPLRPLTLVPVKLNGRGPFLFALDTGASATLISPETAAAAGIEGGESLAIGGAGGASSSGGRLGRVRITLGGVTRDGQPAAIADVLGPISAAAGSPLAGVLGATFFGSGRIVVDYGTRKLWFEPGEERR
jgi:predicted aspartyl protease